MLEHRRQHYLSLLGIDNYVPTRSLANAPSSLLLPDELLIDPALLIRVSTQAQSSEPSNDDSASSATAIAAVADSLRADALVGASVDSVIVNTTTAALGLRGPLDQQLLAQVTPSPSLEGLAVDDGVQTTANPNYIGSLDLKDQSTGVSVERVVKFVFRVWRIKDILILDIRKAREALPTDYLLQNILRSVGYGGERLPASESLRWPLFDNKRFDSQKLDSKRLDNGKDLTDLASTATTMALAAEQYKNDSAQASAMVQAYISAQHSKSPLKYLFLMGEEAATFTLDNAINFADYNGSAISTKFLEDVQCLIMPSLYSMLQEPSSKRIAWSALASMHVPTN